MKVLSKMNLVAGFLVTITAVCASSVRAATKAECESAKEKARTGGISGLNEQAYRICSDLVKENELKSLLAFLHDTCTNEFFHSPDSANQGGSATKGSIIFCQTTALDYVLSASPSYQNTP